METNPKAPEGFEFVARWPRQGVELAAVARKYGEDAKVCAPQDGGLPLVIRPISSQSVTAPGPAENPVSVVHEVLNDWLEENEATDFDENDVAHLFALLGTAGYSIVPNGGLPTPAPLADAMLVSLRKTALAYQPSQHGKLPEQTVGEYLHLQTVYERAFRPDTTLSLLARIAEAEALAATPEARPATPADGEGFTELLEEVRVTLAAYARTNGIGPDFQQLLTSLLARLSVAAARPATSLVEGGAADNWISVGERLPEDLVRVVIARPFNSHYVDEANAVHVGYYNNGGWYAKGEDYDGDDLLDQSVTHWQPLPAAPAARPQQSQEGSRDA